MKIERITETTYQLTRFRLFNCYLVQETDGLTLVDTGFSGAAEQIIEVAAHIGLPIRRIALTHAHGDHVGSVDALVSQLSEIELGASARSIPLLRQPADTTHPKGEAGGKIRGSLPGMRSRVTHELREGDLFGSLRVIETPGHIPGHLSFLDSRDGTLFAGDALTTVGGLNIAGYSPWYFPMPNMFTWNRGIALESARALLKFPIERYASGHGRVLSGGLEALHRSIARAVSKDGAR